MKEPRKESATLARLREKAGIDEHFGNLACDLRRAMVMHLASPTELKQAAALVAYDHSWGYYKGQQQLTPEDIAEEEAKREINEAARVAAERVCKELRMHLNKKPDDGGVLLDDSDVLEADDDEDGDALA